jgi:long-chain acyl-CoA synthetase
MGIATLNDIFFAAVDHNLDRMMLYCENGKWLPISSREFGRYVARVSHTLHSYGIQRGDRIAILSENRPEWSTADIAILLLGAVTVPLYTTLTADQSAFVLNDAGCRAIFVSSELQLRKVLSVLPQTQIEKIVVMDSVELTGDLASHAGKIVSMKQIIAEGPE